MDFLTKIILEKRKRLAQSKASCSVEQLRQRAEQIRFEGKPKALRAALSFCEKVNVIAEVKRASPSRGAIRADADAAQIAEEYVASGAVAISVLTEESQFLGSLDDLRAVRAAVRVPVLRKDFIFDEYQLYETAASGADAVLLIVAALDDPTLASLLYVAEAELRLDALVEVHTRDELRRALACGAKFIGVNNRHLQTFAVALDTSVQLAKDIPADVIAVSESGLRSAADLATLHALGYKGFLIGETLMGAASPGEALRRLLAETQAREASS
jgi:indole-3-glycerol phosphate synthase